MQGRRHKRQIWVLRSRSDGWRPHADMDAFLDWWEAHSAEDREEPQLVWWRRGQGTQDDLQYGDPVVLYECRDARRKLQPGFRAVGVSRSGGPLEEGPNETLLPVELLMRFSRVVPLRAVTTDPLLSQHYFSRFTQVTRYLFQGDDAERLTQVLAAELPGGEGDRLIGLLRNPRT